MSGRDGKYLSLERNLAAQAGDRVTLTLEEIETLIGTALPAGAATTTWWANAETGSRHARAWLAAGWRTVGNRPGQRTVTFVRREEARVSAPGPPKYAPLRRYLAGQSGDRVRLTFAELEALLGAPLPPSAWTRGWWTNVDAARAHTRAWLQAGWRRAEVDVRGEAVVFQRRERQS